MIRKSQRCKSQTLFQYKNRESLQKLKNHLVQPKALPLLLPYKKQSQKSMVLDHKKQVLVIKQKEHSASKLRVRTSLSPARRILSVDKFKTDEIDQKGKFKKQNHQNISRLQTRQHTTQKLRIQQLGKNKNRVSLKIQKVQDFRSIIPQQGFVQIKEKLQNNYKGTEITLSKQGVLEKGYKGLQFKSIYNYEGYIKKVHKLVNLDFFKLYYKVRVFNKWKRLYLHNKNSRICKILSQSLPLNPNNISLVLKQQQILTRLGSNYFILNCSPLDDAIEKEQYDKYLFVSIKKRLQELKTQAYQQFIMELIINLRKLICDHQDTDKNYSNFKLSDKVFQDYFIRKNIDDHEKILLKFTYCYQEVKIQLIFRLVEQLTDKVKYNIQKWSSHFNDSNFTLNDALDSEFSQDGKEEDQPICFYHQTKIKQILIHMKANESIEVSSFKQMGKKIANNFVEQVKRYLRQKYESVFHCDHQLTRLNKNLLNKNVISQREYLIIDKCLRKIDTYCFAEYFKRVNEQLSIGVQKISEIILSNLDHALKAAEFIKQKIQSMIEELVHTKLSFTFDYCGYIQKIKKRVSKIPSKLKMGMFCLDLTDVAQYYEATIKSNYEIITGQCLKVFREKIKGIDSHIESYQSNINISSWSIKAFILSFRNSNDYLFCYDNLIKDNFKQLDSILMTIHRLQPRFYQQSYLDLFHCKQRSQIIRSKSMCFLREITHKLNYLSIQKQKRIGKIHQQIGNIQSKMVSLVSAQNIQFNHAFTSMNLINDQLQIQAKQIEQITNFIEIQRLYITKQGKSIQFLAYDKLKNEVNFLLKLLNSYKQFEQMMNQQLNKDYNNFRLELLVDGIHNEIAKIKQSIRFLHHYQKFLVNISSFYQGNNAKIRLLRIAMQLQINDLVKLDNKNFAIHQKYTAKQMLEYIQVFDKNQNIIKIFLEEKQYTTKVKEKIGSIETKVTKFVLINSTLNFDQKIHQEVNNFIQMLQRSEYQLQDYFKNQNLKDLKTHIYDSLTLLRKCIKFLIQYTNIFQLYTLYQSYLKKPSNQEQVVNKFLNMFREESKELTQICQKWWELNIDIKQSNLKGIADHRYQSLIERIYILQSLIKIEMNKINIYLNKRKQQFPLLYLLPTNLLVNVVNQPLLFIKYIHTTVKQVYWQRNYLEEQHRKNIIINTIYDQKVIIPLQISQSIKNKYRQEKTQKYYYKVELQNCMTEITQTIKNSILNLISNSFQNYLQPIFSQKIPLQSVFTSDQINNYNMLITNKSHTELFTEIDKQINILLDYRQKEEFSKYQAQLIDILLISKLEFKNKISQNSETEVFQFIVFAKKQDDVYLELYTESIKLDYQLVDVAQFTIVEPINYRTFIKLYESIIQVKSCFLFQSSGLHNIACRIMKNLFIVDEREVSLQVAVNLSIKQSAIFYFKSNREDDCEFYNKIANAYTLINNALFEREKKAKNKLQSYKFNMKPLIYIEIPLALYTGQAKTMNDFQTFYRHLSVEQRSIFRVIQFFQPSLCLLLKLCLIHEDLTIDNDLQCKILQEFIIYKDKKLANNQCIMNHRDILLAMKRIVSNLILFEKIQEETIKLCFKILMGQISIEDIDQKIQRKKTIIFKSRKWNGKNYQAILKWQQIKLNDQFIRFSKQMDQILLEDQSLMVVGKPCTGKSYMIKLYYEMINEQNKNLKERGKIGVSTVLMKLQGIDLSLIAFDENYVRNQIKIISKDSKQNSQYLWLLWFNGIEKLDNSTIQDILHKNSLINLDNIDYKIIIQLSNMDNLSPRIALSYKHIIIRQKSFSILEIIHINKQQILYLLSDTILHKVIDPFTIFAKIIKDFFVALRKIAPNIFVINYQQELIVIHTFQLLIGIIKHKSPKLVQHFETLKQNEKIQSLRKLFAFCFLWVTSSLLQENISKKFEQLFLQICKRQQIDTHSIGCNYIINHKSDIIEYIAIKQAKDNLLKVEPTIINNSNVFIHTSQTVILNNLLLYITSNSVSKVIIFGENQTGKTAILHHFITNSSKNYRHFYYICSLYTYNCLKTLNKSLKEMNSVYQREKVQLMLKEEKTKQVKWYMNLAKSKCVFVQNISMDLWCPILSYFKYITSLERIFVDGQICDFRNIHLLLQRNSGYKLIGEQKHFLRIKINYQKGYFNDVFNGIYEIVCKNCSANDTCFQILKIKGAIIKNLLLLMKLINKNIKHSIHNWTYFYPLSTLKHILQEIKNKTFRSRGQFLQGLFQEIEFQLYRRMKDQTSKVILYKLLQSCKQHIKQDLKEGFILEEPSYLKVKEEEIILKLTNYLQYKNQFKNLKKSKTLISNLSQFYQALNKKPLIVLNFCSIPGVGPFLPVAVEILGLQLIQINSLQNFQLVTSQTERHTHINKQDFTLYYIPSWILKNEQVLASLSNKIRNLQYTVRIKRNKRLSQILGTNTNQNKCYFIIEYNDKIEKKELNILKYNQLMKSATFLHLQQPARSEMLVELNQFLGKQREQLNVKQNQLIINKIKRIYDIFQSEQLLKKIDPGMQHLSIFSYEYLFSIQNYFRFIKIIIDTYFQRKYQIKSNQNQLQITIIKLQQLIQQYKNIKAKNTQLKCLFNESKKKISALNESYHFMSEHLTELMANKKYLSLKDKKSELNDYQKIKQKMMHKEQSLLNHIDNFKAIPRMEIANLKSLFNNNSESFLKPIFESLSILISDSDQPSIVKKTICDINLNLKIKQINFKEKKPQTIQIIQQKLSTNIFEQQEYKVCYSLVSWLKYSIQYFNFRKELNQTLNKIAIIHQEAYGNQQAIEVEANIQKANVEIDQIKDRIEKQKHLMKEIDFNLKQSDNFLKNLTKFTEMEHLKDECEKQQQFLAQQYKLCLQSSIFFSVKLNLIYASDLFIGEGVQLIRGKQKCDSYRVLMQKMFVKWACETVKDVDLNFFKHQIHKIFSNKEKYEFIDKQLQFQEGNHLIAKCKKIGATNMFVDHSNQQNKDLQLFLPHTISNKFIYLKYVLNIRYNTHNILLIDPYCNINKYLSTNYANKIMLKKNSPKNDSKSIESSYLNAYLLKPHQSSIIDTNYHILFIQLPKSAQQIYFAENKRQANGAGFFIKINFNQFIVPYYQNLKVVYTCKQIMEDTHFLHQFYCIRFEQNSADAMDIINHQVLNYHLNKMSGGLSLISCIKQSANVVLNQSQIRSIVAARKRERLSHYLEKKEKQLKFQIVEMFTNQCNQKFTLQNQNFIQRILKKIDEWKAANKQWKQCMVNSNALKSYCAKFINPFTENLLQIYKVYFATNKTIFQRERVKDRNHQTFTYYAKIIRQGLKYLLLTEQSSIIEKQLIVLEKYVLNYICNLTPHKDYMTFSLFLKIYSLKSYTATNAQIMNLFATFNYQNFIENLIQYKVDSFAHAAHFEMPAHKIQIEKALKIIKDIRSGKGDYVSKMKGKNFILSPQHINDFINHFQFKIIRKVDHTESELQDFKKFSLFTKLLLQKWLVPQICLKNCWQQACIWKQKYINIESSNYSLQNICFFFCDVRFWTLWLNSSDLKNIQFVKINEIGPQEGNKRLYIIVEEGDDKIQFMVRQKLQELMTMRVEKSILILAHQKSHTFFHQILRNTHNIKDIDEINVQCLEVYQFLHLIQSIGQKQVSNEEANKKKIQLNDRRLARTSFSQEKPNQAYAKWAIIKNKAINSHSFLVQRIVMAPFLNQIQQQIFSQSIANPKIHYKSFLKLAHNKLILQQAYRFYEVQNFTNREEQINTSITHQDLIASLVFPTTTEAYHYKQIHSLMSNLCKNKMSIGGYLKNKLTSFKENHVNRPASKSKYKPSHDIFEQIEIRYAFEDDEQILEQIIRSSKSAQRRATKISSYRSRNNTNMSNRIIPQEYQIVSFLYEKSKKLIASIQAMIDDLLVLWKIYEGQKILIVDQFKLHRCCSNSTLQYFAKRYKEIIAKILQNEQLISIKQYRKLQVLYTQQNVRIFMNQCRQSNSLFLNYHFSSKKQYEVVIKCYASDKCEDCSLMKKKGSERICIVIKNVLYELSYHNQLMVKDYNIPYINICTGFDLIQAKIYCKKIVTDIL